MKTFLTLFCTFMILLLHSSCNTTYLSEHADENKFKPNGDGGYRFYNDSLMVSLNLYGDHTAGMQNNKIDNKTFRKYKKMIESNIPGIKVGKENFIYRTRTTVEPWIESSLFEFENADNIKNQYITDSIGGIILCLHPCGNKNYVNIYTIETHYKNFWKTIKSEIEVQHRKFECGDSYEPIASPAPFRLAMEAMKDSANYLAPLYALYSIERFNYSLQEKDLWEQAALTFHSFVSDNPDFEKLLSKRYNNRNKALAANIYDEDALRYIKDRIGDRRLVMINEMHWNPKHRYLGNLLLEHLYKEGFRYLAVEAVGAHDDSLGIRKYPLQTSGFYTREPQFGNFLRNAMNMGFTIVPYEQMGKDREIKQAENIYSQTFKVNPDAKVLVWAGIAHIYKNHISKPRMAYHLKEISGIEPLSIDQTQSEHVVHNLKNHYLAINEDSTRNYQQCDIFVCNNISEADFRLIPGAEEKEIQIPLSEEIQRKLKQHGKLLCMVYLQNEFSAHRFDAVPVVNKLITREKDISINLPAGNYTILIRTPLAFVVEQLDVTI